MPATLTWFSWLVVTASLWLQQAQAYVPLSDISLRHIPHGGADFDIHHGSLLAPMLIPRVPDTPGSAQVRKHFIDFFSSQLPQWTIEWHNSTSTTPATGKDRLVTFHNLIFRRDPPWTSPGDVSRLTLVAHYDSMFQPEGFIGATDSAVPCAILMHVARSIDAQLTAKWQSMQDNGEAGEGLEAEVGVQILFLDGEEAWVKWSDTDSTYGSRALAEHWEGEAYGPLSTHKTPLDAISLFVLLDLLGAENPSIASYFVTTHWAYKHLASIEERMRALSLLESRPKRPFLPAGSKPPQPFLTGIIGDDHVPFMQRGVEVMHLIPHPFPEVWHTMNDDAAHLHMPTVRDWAKIMTAFVAEWMELEDYMGVGKKEEERDEWKMRTEL